jgi:hypothetical protein
MTAIFICIDLKICCLSLDTILSQLHPTPILKTYFIIIRTLSTYTPSSTQLNQFNPDLASRQPTEPAWQISIACIQCCDTPDDGQWTCPKHVEYFTKLIWEIVHLVGFHYKKNLFGSQYLRMQLSQLLPDKTFVRISYVSQVNCMFDQSYCPRYH